MATKKALTLHVLTIAGTQIGIDQSDADYTSIGDIVGIKKAPDNADVTAHMEVAEVMKNGLAIRLACRLANKKTNYVLCAVDKVASARAALRGKSLGGSTIKKAGIPRKRSRR